MELPPNDLDGEAELPLFRSEGRQIFLEEGRGGALALTGQRQADL